MIVFDTNVVSELMRERPNERVADWAESLRTSETRLSAVTSAELLLEIAKMPGGRRRDALAEAVARLLGVIFDGRILPFDTNAATHYARIVVVREKLGRPISTGDAMIAAVAASSGAVLATRNTRDFTELGLELINPWDEA